MSINANDFKFSCPLTVSIKDINYGGHVGNDSYLSYFQEARIGYLNNLGFSEMDIGGNGMIQSRAEVEFKAEMFHGDKLTLFCRIAKMKKSGFTMEYLIKKEDGTVSAAGNTVLISFDYKERKVTKLPEIFVTKVKEWEGEILGN